MSPDSRLISWLHISKPSSVSLHLQQILISEVWDSGRVDHKHLGFPWVATVIDVCWSCRLLWLHSCLQLMRVCMHVSLCVCVCVTVCVDYVLAVHGCHQGEIQRLSIFIYCCNPPWRETFYMCMSHLQCWCILIFLVLATDTAPSGLCYSYAAVSTMDRYCPSCIDA